MENTGFTELLGAARDGDPDALDRMVPLVQDELRRIAERHLRRERRDHTLQPTALVNEAYLRLVDQRERSWQNRDQFFGVAATLMRRVLVSHAAARRTAKRGGDRGRVTMVEAVEVFEERATDLIGLDEALDRLDHVDPRKRRIVELRFFSGLTIPEIARILGLSVRSVERSWSFSRAWLHKEITGR